MGIFKRVGNFLQTRQTNRLAAKQKRLETKQSGKTDRELANQSALSERASIAASAGFDPLQDTSSGGGGKLKNFLSNAKDTIGSFFGGGQAASQSPESGEPKKDNTMIYVLGGIGAAVALYFGMKKKK